MVDLGEIEGPKKLFTKRSPPMMFRLVTNLVGHLASAARTNGDCRVTFLPLKPTVAECFSEPDKDPFFNSRMESEM